MKLWILYMITALIPFDSEFYGYHIDCPDGRQVYMSDFRGRKVIVAVFDASNPDTSQLHLLDSIIKSISGAAVVDIAASDFSGPGTDSILYNLQESFGNSPVLSRAVRATKAAGENQNALLQWLTNVTQNGHFDRDVEAAGQLFFINESGVLYGILNSDATGADIAEALGQQINP